MNRSTRYFSVPFEGLKLGKHSFNFEITDEFFTSMEYSEIEKGSLKVDFLLDKRENMMVGEIAISGSVTVTCDRCTEPFALPLEIEEQVVFKFDDEESEDEHLVCIPSNAFSIELQPILYEIIAVAIPFRTIHPEGECNEEMASLVNEYTLHNFEEEEEEDFSAEEEEIDPRWEQLKKLSKK